MNYLDIFNLIKKTIERDFKENLRLSIFNSISQILDLKIQTIRNYRNIFVVSVGKASLTMYNTLIDILKTYNIHTTRDIVIYDSSINNLDILNTNKSNVEFIGSTHPYVNQNSFVAAKKVIDLIIQNDDINSLFLFLISGGSSAMIEDSVIPYMTLSEIYKMLLNLNINIYELNKVRTFLSTIKGGKILQYFSESKIMSFIISDVPFNDIDTIGSGLTTHYKRISYSEIEKMISFLSNNLKVIIDAKLLLNVINKNKEIDKIMEAKEEYLKNNLENFVLLDNFKAVYMLFKKLLENFNLDKNLKLNDLKIEIAFSHLDLDIYSLCNLLKSFVFTKLNEVKQYINEGNTKSRVDIYLFGGETFLNVLKQGYGGRIQHLALIFVKELYTILKQINIDNLKEILFVALATDGKDGNTNNAGVILPIMELIKSDTEIINKLEKYISNFNSGVFFDNPKNKRYVIKFPYGLINLNEIYMLVFIFNPII